MHVIAVCGPIGSPIREFVKQFPNATIIDEAHYLTVADVDADADADVETEADPYPYSNSISVNFNRLRAAIPAEPEKLVIVAGHYLLSDEELRRHCDVKVFIETPSDICLSNFIKLESPDKALKQIDLYETRIKAKNDQEINPLKKHADFYLPHTKIDGYITELLRTPIAPIEEQHNSPSASLNFFSVS
ncbi:uridine/cytidine kinase [Legionella massiliensis]|uniref:Uridine/cytidine kinase n=1 Tax=Legionella massiliensis TaxID=1034943 RepID=A0A078KW85_9GAMM|nr:hypothetical protein [Legionella massiliensis]CDZ78725.1 uridine/cytidine kinase [Legionella massiliensis]CEE14463.1 Uridine kinase [Legionella massiliensis]